MAEGALLYYSAVREDVRALLQAQGLSDDFLEALYFALSVDGKLFSSRCRSKWPLLALLGCWGAGGNWQEAVPVATAAELVGLSTDVFDEIEDGDESPVATKLGMPRATNVAMALLTLAGCSLSRAPEGISRPVWSAVLTATGGQHQDLGRQVLTTAEEYLALADRKAAGLIAAFCAAGASVAGAAPSIVAGYARFGLHLGRLAQLANDLHDAWPTAKGKSDLERRLITLPIIFVLSGPNGPFRERLGMYLNGTGPVTPSEEQDLRAGLLASGALHYTWLMAEANRSAATAALRETCPTSADGILQLLLPPVQDLSGASAD